MKEKLYIIKIGGASIDDEELLNEFLEQFSEIKEKKILVHGGGKLATTLADKLGVEQKWSTDEESQIKILWILWRWCMREESTKILWQNFSIKNAKQWDFQELMLI